MNEKQIVTMILMSGVLIAFGLIPGLLSGLKEGIQNVRAELLGLPTILPRHGEYPKWLPGQIWFAVAGFVLGTAGLAALLTH